MKGAQIAILDEPTSGLDPQATTELLGIIRGFKAEGVSVLLSSHLLERVQSVCDRVALFSAGKIALMGTVPDLGREVLGGGYVVDIEADGAGLPNGLRSFRASAASRRPASASFACMPTATCGRKRRPKSSRCRAASNSSASRSRASKRSIRAISRPSPKTAVPEGARHAA